MFGESTGEWKKVGEVPVDAGCVLISDPCYVLRDDKKPGMPYDVLLDHSSDWYGQGVVDLGHEPKGEFGATLIQNFGGDGSFPLYAKLDRSGRVEAVMIDFTFGAAATDVGFAAPDDEPDDEPDEDEPDDEYDVVGECEICGRPVKEADADPQAFEHGVAMHVQCVADEKQ